MNPCMRTSDGRKWKEPPKGGIHRPAWVFWQIYHVGAQNLSYDALVNECLTSVEWKNRWSVIILLRNKRSHVIKSVFRRWVAQPGSAPALGAGGRWFDSSLTDQQIQGVTVYSVAPFCVFRNLVILRELLNCLCKGYLRAEMTFIIALQSWIMLYIKLKK